MCVLPDYLVTISPSITLRRTASALTVCILLALSSVSFAQGWRVLGSVSLAPGGAKEPIYSVFFFHEYGWPTVGLAGTNTALYRTTDAGATWTKVFNTFGKVQSIVMKDRDNGWIAVGASPTKPAVYWTSNMGISWVAISNLKGLADDLAYNSKTGRVFLSFLTNQTNSYMSTDLGLNWSAMGPNTLNGYAFTSDGKYGIVTPWLGADPTIGAGMRTADGGVTWSTFDINRTVTEEIWKPVALRGTRVFCTLDDNTRDFSISTDAGLTWHSKMIFPEAMTGTLQGTLCALFAQSFTRMYVTYDTGTWQDIGGPGNYVDTRFQVVQNFVFAGDDTGAIWRYYQPDLPASSLAVSIDKPAVRDTKALGCAPDTAWVTIKNIACDTQIVDTLLIMDSSVWKMQRIAMPDTLGIGDSVRIRLIATNPHPGSYASSVNLHWRLQNWSSDTTFTLQYDVTGIRKPTIAALALNVKDRCSIIDTFVTVRNEQCDTLQLFQVALDDSTSFRLGVTSLPVLLAPGQIYRIPVHIAAPAKGIYTAKVRVTLHDLGFTLDTVVTLTLNVNNAIPFKIPVAFTRDMGKVSVCGFKDAPFIFTNTACDTIRLLKAEIVAPAQDFSLRGVPPVPQALVSGASDTLGIHFETTVLGGQQVSVHLQFLLDGVVHDTSFTVMAAGAQTLEAAASSTVMSFAAVTACDSSVQTVYIKNLSCYEVSLTDLQLPPGSNFRVVSPALPQPIKAGDSILVTVRFIGSLPVRSVADKLDATLKDSTQQKVVSVDLAATVKTGQRDIQLSAASIVADSLEPCSTFSTIVRLWNKGTCDPVAITTVTFSGGGGFTLFGNPKLVQVGDSLELQLMGATTSGAVVDGTIRITGFDFDTVINVHLSVKHTGLPNAVVTSSAPNFTGHSCQQQTLFVHLHNDGCAPLEISEVHVASSGTQYSIIPAWPASAFTVSANADTTIAIAFDPALTGDGTATVVITLKDGSTRTVSFVATIVPLHSARVLLTPGTATKNPRAGNTTDAHLAFADDVDVNDGLTELRGVLQLDQDFLTVRSVTGLNGWTITPEAGAAGTYQFLARRTAPVAIVSGDGIADLVLAAYVAKQTQTDMALTSVHFMPGVAGYESCTLAPLSTPISHVEFALDPLCGDNTISTVMRGDPILSIRSINPNPAQSGEITVGYATGAGSELMIVDIAGNTVRRTAIDERQHSIHLSTKGLPSGRYQLMLRSGELSVTKPFVIEK